MKVKAVETGAFRPKTILVSIDTPHDLAALWLGLYESAMQAKENSYCRSDMLDPLGAVAAVWEKVDEMVSKEGGGEKREKWCRNHLGCIEEIKGRTPE